MRRRSGLSWSLATLLLTRALGAQSPPSTIVLAFDASSEAQKQAIAAIRAHVSDLSADVVVLPVEHQRTLDSRLATAGSLAASRRALGTFYIEIAPDGALLVFFTEAEGEATLIRRLPPSPQGLRVALEQAGIVVRSLVEALLDGGSVGIAPEAGRAGANATDNVPNETEPSPKPPSPTPLSASRQAPSTGRSPTSTEGASVPPRLAISAGYTVTDFAAGMPWQSGFSGGLEWLATPVFYAGARYTFFPNATFESDDAVVSVGRHPIEGVVGYHGANRLAFNGELGLLADGTTRTTVRTAPSLRATSPSVRWMLALAARAGFSWSPWARVRASARVGADFVLTHYIYTIDSTAAVPSPHWVRPRMELELAVALW